MIMSFWPTSLWIEENKKKGVSEHRLKQGEGEWRSEGREKMSPEQNKKSSNMHSF